MTEPQASPLQIASTHCRITIQPPGGTQPDWEPETMGFDLRQVHTHNDMAEACGTFTLVLAPRAGQARTPAAAIPLGSMVTIEFYHPLYPQMTAQDRTVMIGRIEHRHVTLDYSQRQVRRQFVLSGRSVASALLTTTWYHAAFEKDPSSGTLRSGTQIYNFYWTSTLTPRHQDPRDGLTSVLHYLLGLPSRRPLIGAPETPAVPAAAASTGSPVPPVAQQGPTTQALVIQQDIATLRAQNPALTLKQAAGQILARQEQAFWNSPEGQPMPGTGGRVLANRPVPARVQAQPPTPVPSPPAALPEAADPIQDTQAGKQLVHWGIPGVTLADVLDTNNDQWTLFEDGLRVPVTGQIGQTNTVWNLLHYFIDPLFQEFFTRIERGVCAIHFRGKPFQQAEVTKGSRFVPDDDTLTTLTCGPSSLLHADLEGGAAHVYNIFRIMPLGAQALIQERSLVLRVIPTILEDPEHPSNVLRWGPHPLDHKSPYLNGIQTLPTTPEGERDSETVDAAKRWGKLASWWYGWAPELMAGTFTVLGSPVWNVGHRFLYDDGQGDPWEAYIEGVDHTYTYDPASQSGRYLSQLRLTRIWSLSGAIDRRGSGEVVQVNEPTPGPTEKVFRDLDGGFE